MRNIRNFTLCLCAVLAMLPLVPMRAQGTLSDGSHWRWEKGTIVIDTPARPAGQKSALGLTVPKMKVVRVGFVGLGMRGPGAVHCAVNTDGVQVVAVCDHEVDRAQSANKILTDAGFPAAAVYSGDSGYVALCKRPDIDLVYVATDWLHHFPVAKCALENGKNVAIEVPSAMNLDEIWKLTNLSEKARKHCMLLENCCYDWFELDALTMAQAGVFGELLHGEGAYIHCLDQFWDEYWKTGKDDKLGWRLEFNMKHRGDVYATHGLGPVAQAFNIHRGDRIKTLVAMDTKSVRGKELVAQRLGACDTFRNGDHTTTLLRTEQGKVIEIQHDVMNPQPYNRKFQLTGTKGFINKYPVEGIALSSSQMKASGVAPKADNLSGHEFIPNADMQALREKYKNPLAVRYGKKAREMGGHGGMDYTEFARLIYCLQNGLPLDIDVYDLGEWCCLAELGELSMDNGCAPVAVPDFTRGHWNEANGFHYAFATPEQEKETAAAAHAFTVGYKQGGVKFAKKFWQEEAKQAKKRKGGKK